MRNRQLDEHGESAGNWTEGSREQRRKPGPGGAEQRLGFLGPVGIDLTASKSEEGWSVSIGRVSECVNSP